MILDREGNLTTTWQVTESSAAGALSYSEAAQVLVRFQNSLGLVRGREKKARFSILKVGVAVLPMSFADPPYITSPFLSPLLVAGP